jgi:hypothetical protein
MKRVRCLLRCDAGNFPSCLSKREVKLNARRDEAVAITCQLDLTAIDFEP